MIPSPEPRQPSADPDPHLERELESLIAALGRMSPAHPDVARILHIVDRLSDWPYRTHCLLTGEPGTGKTGLAKLLHRLMHPAGGPLEIVSTVGLPPDELAATLLGRRAPGGQGSPGALARARGGTLVLDEILALDPSLQRQLLTGLRSSHEAPPDRPDQPASQPDQPDQIDRVGRVTLIAMSDHDPLAAVADGRLRHDLYYRVARIVMRLPPLRERPGDLQQAALWMANRVLHKQRDPRHAELLGATPPSDGAYQVLPEAIATLQAYPFPGNFREMEAVVERAIFLYSDGSRLTAEDVRRSLP